jgi:hypothetical protein
MNGSDDRDEAARPEWMTLSWQEVDSALQAALDNRGAADEWVTRYARPDEREEIGRRIDPETARVFFIYAQMLDPYGDAEVPEECRCAGRAYFAVDPSEGVAVEWGDLPEATSRALEAKRAAADREG